MVDKSWIGRDVGSSTFEVERGRVRAFSRAIGEGNAIHYDVEAARAAGYPDIPVPPTFVFGIELESSATDRMLTDMQISYERLLHGEQGFTYLKPVCAGDTVTVTSQVADVYEKKNGALTFVERHSEARNQRGEMVAKLRSVFVVRN